MTYTKMNTEIEKWLKENNLPFKGRADDTKEQTQERLDAYKQGRDVVIESWLSQKKYKALISVAHNGWFSDDELFIPLAEYFVKTQDLVPLKFLGERGIRFAVEDMIFSVKQIERDAVNENLAAINAIDLEDYARSKTYSSVGETAKWRKIALDRIDRHIAFVEQLPASDYLDVLRSIRDKIISLQIKKKDLNGLKTKLVIQ